MSPIIMKTAENYWNNILAISDNILSIQDKYEYMFDFFKDHILVKGFLLKKGLKPQQIATAKCRFKKELENE